MTEFPAMLKDWKILSKSHSHKSRAIYNVVCPYCGDTVKLSRLHMNQNKSCGCMQYKLNGRPTHGDSQTRLYHTWQDMKKRCHKDPYYINVSVCKEWLDYPTFKTWAKASGYKDYLTIDRRDGTGDYEPSNCRWANHNVQTQNQRIRRDNTSGYTGVRVMTFNGVRSHSVTFKADISHNGRRIYLGGFDNAEDAVIARNNYILENKTSHKIQIVKG